MWKTKLCFHSFSPSLSWLHFELIWLAALDRTEASAVSAHIHLQSVCSLFVWLHAALSAKHGILMMSWPSLPRHTPSFIHMVIACASRLFLWPFLFKIRLLLTSRHEEVNRNMQTSYKHTFYVIQFRRTAEVFGTSEHLQKICNLSEVIKHVTVGYKTLLATLMKNHKHDLLLQSYLCKGENNNLFHTGSMQRFQNMRRIWPCQSLCSKGFVWFPVSTSQSKI